MNLSDSTLSKGSLKHTKILGFLASSYYQMDYREKYLALTRPYGNHMEFLYEAPAKV